MLIVFKSARISERKIFRKLTPLPSRIKLHFPSTMAIGVTGRGRQRYLSPRIITLLSVWMVPSESYIPTYYLNFGFPLDRRTPGVATNLRPFYLYGLPVYVVVASMLLSGYLFDPLLTLLFFFVPPFSFNFLPSETSPLRIVKRPTLPDPVVPPTAAAREASSSSFFRLICFVMSYTIVSLLDPIVERFKQSVNAVWKCDSRGIERRREHTACFTWPFLIVVFLALNTFATKISIAQNEASGTTSCKLMVGGCWDILPLLSCLFWAFLCPFASCDEGFLSCPCAIFEYCSSSYHRSAPSWSKTFKPFGFHFGAAALL